MNELARPGHAGVGSDFAPVYSGAADSSPATEMLYVSLDITDPQAVRQALLEIRPDAVVHCAAWTAVDAAEAEENCAKIHAINVNGTAHIANVCKDLDAKMIYISTDYIFDGQGAEPWQADCTDYAPLSVYGHTKLEGENAVRNTLEKYFIVRISWVFGVNGKNFIKTMLNVGLVDKIHPFRSNHRDSNKKQTPPGVIQYTLSSF